MQRKEGTKVNISEITESHGFHSWVNGQNPQIREFFSSSARVTRENPKHKHTGGWKTLAGKRHAGQRQDSADQAAGFPFLLILFISWLYQVLAAAWGILVPQPGIESRPPAQGARSLSLWTPRGVPSGSPWTHCFSPLIITRTKSWEGRRVSTTPQAVAKAHWAWRTQRALTHVGATQELCPRASRGCAHRDQTARPCAQASSHVGRKSGRVIGRKTLVVRNTSTISRQCRGQRENQKANYRNSYHWLVMKIVRVKLGVTELKLYFKISFNPKCLFQKKKKG